MPPGKPVELNRIPRDPVERLEDPLAQYDPSDVRAVVAEVKELRDALRTVSAENKQAHDLLAQAQRAVDNLCSEMRKNHGFLARVISERDDAEAMLEQMTDALIDLHFPVEITLYGGATRWVCDHCNTGDPYVTVSNEWPCPTAKAMQGYVEEDGDDDE